jgi:hypothetical protein
VSDRQFNISIQIRWIHLLPAIVKEDSVSRQSSIDLFGYDWIHLLPEIVKEDTQPSI